MVIIHKTVAFVYNDAEIDVLVWVTLFLFCSTEQLFGNH